MASNKFSACYGCEKRYIGCHAVCKDYLKEVNAHRQEQEQIYAARGKNREYYSYKKSIEHIFR